MTAVLLVVEQLRRRVPGGIGRYAAGLLEGLAAGDPAPVEPEVSLYASRPPRHGTDPLERFGRPVLTSRLPAVALTRAWDRRLVAAPRGFDVVHAVSLAAPPPVRFGRRPALAVTVHDLAWRPHPEAATARGRRWHEAALARALEAADALVVPSTVVAADLRAAGARPEAVHVLPWGADHLPAPDRPAASALLRRLGVDGRYLLTASTLEPRKNLARLVAAYARARPDLPEPWPLVVVGPAGWGASGLGAIPEGVVAAGPVDDAVLAALYAGARTFAYVPLAEGYGFPPVEAMRWGIPVVASTAVPSVDPGPAGPAPAVRVDPASEEAIADALVAASVDGAVRARLGEAGTAWALPRTWRRAARAHADLWAALAKGRAR